MQQRKIFLLLACVFGFMGYAGAEELQVDETGPTAPEAVETAVVGDDFLAPSYVIPEEPDTFMADDPEGVPSEIDILNEIFGPSESISLLKPVPQARPAVAKTFAPIPGIQRIDEDRPLLTPLPPLTFEKLPEGIEPKKRVVLKTEYADQAITMAESGTLNKLNMPREIKITFYPGQASFSAQALKWAKSFAIHVVRDPRLVAEIRISHQNWSIQEKRLKILLQILKEAGVSVHQIRVYKTKRDVNSILMGYKNDPEKGQGVTKIVGEKKQKTIEW